MSAEIPIYLQRTTLGLEEIDRRRGILNSKGREALNAYLAQQVEIVPATILENVPAQQTSDAIEPPLTVLRLDRLTSDGANRRPYLA